MKFHILTLFPEMVTQGLSASILGRAAEQGLIAVDAVNIRDFTLNKHKKVDDYPYGGGAGMLMQAQPVYDAWKSVARQTGKKPRTVYLTPQGRTFNQQLAKEFAKEEELVLLCGHYEGIDERVLEEIVTDFVSVGDYVLTGGELPAMILVDAISRMVPGVLTNEESGSAESFEGNLLEYPQYSRPEVWQGKAVPAVLLSGNQKRIREWRKEAAAARTKERRPDLYIKYEALERCREILLKQKLLHIDMTELIARGQAELVYAKGKTICLFDTVSKIYFHTSDTAENGIQALKAVKKHAVTHIYAGGADLLVLHQDFMRPYAVEILGLEEFMACRQAVYTRKEKLPAGKSAPVCIRRIGTEYFDTVTEHYQTIDDKDYLFERLEKGFIYGAFLEEKLVGFIGIHAEGSLGMLEVFPEYRGRKIAKALETHMINLSLEQGQVPFGQVKTDNLISMKLQASLGLCFSKTEVYWFEKKYLQ